MTDAFATKTREHIEAFGCSVIHVMEMDGHRPFAYSIGVHQQTGAPEVVVIGLKQKIAHFVVNEYQLRVRAGERFEAGKAYPGFLEGFDVQFDEVPPNAYDDHFGRAIGYYGHSDFKVLQMIYPTTRGVWPWDDDAPEGFRSWQPILSLGDIA